jgi:hypothetical protein
VGGTSPASRHLRELARLSRSECFALPSGIAREACSRRGARNARACRAAVRARGGAAWQLPPQGNPVARRCVAYRFPQLWRDGGPPVRRAVPPVPRRHATTAQTEAGSRAGDPLRRPAGAQTQLPNSSRSSHSAARGSTVARAREQAAPRRASALSPRGSSPAGPRRAAETLWRHASSGATRLRTRWHCRAQPTARRAGAANCAVSNVRGRLARSPKRGGRTRAHRTRVHATTSERAAHQRGSPLARQAARLQKTLGFVGGLALRKMLGAVRISPLIIRGYM